MPRLVFHLFPGGNRRGKAAQRATDLSNGRKFPCLQASHTFGRASIDKCRHRMRDSNVVGLECDVGRMVVVAGDGCDHAAGARERTPSPIRVKAAQKLG